ncbi:uncharacterized protein [Venturia canescens]|uniref:uncharacterized protein n=1 Tax=Venturia canescens TaxID=32260 RepID=UPI001C9D20FF|nr:uncharacterized protein LOC122407775 [Venturia canescens]
MYNAILVDWNNEIQHKRVTPCGSRILWGFFAIFLRYLWATRQRWSRTPGDGGPVTERISIKYLGTPIDGSSCAAGAAAHKCAVTIPILQPFHSLPLLPSPYFHPVCHHRPHQRVVKPHPPLPVLSEFSFPDPPHLSHYYRRFPNSIFYMPF